MAIVVVVTGVAVAVSVVSPPRYRADARIADDSLASDTADATAAERRLATSRELVTTAAVLEAAAGDVSAETTQTLAGKVSASVDPAASILDVAATDRDPRHAADIANAVATAFLAERTETQLLALQQAQTRLRKEIKDQKAAGARQTTLDELNGNLASLTASQVAAGTGLSIAQRATAPSQPYAPRPLRSALVAFLAAILVGVLIAVTRDRLRRRGPDAETLSREVELPLIAVLPATDLSRRQRRDPRMVDGVVIEEAALQAAVRVALPPRGQRVLLVHGTRHDDGPARVAAALARSLAWAGHSTVLVGVDAPGGARTALQSPGPDVPVVRCTDVDEQLDDLRRSDYRYIIVPTPRGAPGAELRELAAHASGVILVARLGETSLEDAVAARRLIGALALHGIGLVVTCAPEDAPSVARTGFGKPVRPRARSRSHAANGAQAEGAPAPQPEPAPEVER